MYSIFAAQPLYAPLLPLLERMPDTGETMSLDLLNELASARCIATGSGAPLRFVVPRGSGLSYEERTWWLGEVETRPGNWHDCFNALVWLTFPLSKAALNFRHHHSLVQRRAGHSRRGPLRDALTQFDECGVVLASPNLELWKGIRAHHWQDVFWTQRAEVERSLKVFVFGHASFDLLRNPHIGLCGKAMFLHVDDEWLTWPAAVQIADVDARVALRLGGAMPVHASPRDFHPLPLLGLPGATPDNRYPDYYRNTRQFRPLQLIGGAQS
jgi:hypothetical protein